MGNLLYAELLKLKRSQMFLISLFGAAAAPFVCFVAFLNMKSREPSVPVEFATVFAETNMFIMLLVGVPLYGVITAYLFNREYAEDTLKNLLTIPVSRHSFFLSKLTVLFAWIGLLTLAAFGLTVVLGLIAGFERLSVDVVITAFQQYTIGGLLLFLLSTSAVLVTLLFKSYVPTIVFTLVVTMTNVLIVKSEHIAVFPWSAVHVIATGSFVPQYPPEYSYLSIFITSAAGFLAAVVYFAKDDIK